MTDVKNNSVFIKQEHNLHFQPIPRPKDLSEYNTIWYKARSTNNSQKDQGPQGLEGSREGQNDHKTSDNYKPKYEIEFDYKTVSRTIHGLHDNKHCILALEPQDVNQLIKLSNLWRLKNFTHLTDDDILPFKCTRFFQSITSLLMMWASAAASSAAGSRGTLGSYSGAASTKGTRGLFLKGPNKSAKNDFKIVPLTTFEDVVFYIIESEDVMTDLTTMYKLKGETYVVCMPWNSEVCGQSSGNEVRIYTSQQRVVGICPQNCYASHSSHLLAKPEARELVHELIDFVETKIANKWPVGRSRPAGPVGLVIDMYYSAVNKRWTLIEVNNKVTSGSSCFNWTTDEALLDGNIDVPVADPVVRYFLD